MWQEYYEDMTRYQKEGRNAHDDAQDATTGVIEKMQGGADAAQVNRGKWLAGGF